MRVDGLAFAAILAAVATTAPTDVDRVKMTAILNGTDQLNEITMSNMTGATLGENDDDIVFAANNEAEAEFVDLPDLLEYEDTPDKTEITIQALPVRGQRSNEYGNNYLDGQSNDQLLDYQQDYDNRRYDQPYGDRRSQTRRPEYRREQAIPRSPAYRQTASQYQPEDGVAQRYRKSSGRNYESNDRFAESLERSKYEESLERAAKYRGSTDHAMRASEKSPAGDHHESYPYRMDEYAKQRKLDFEDQMRARDHDHDRGSRSRPKKEESGFESLMKEMGWADDDEEDEERFNEKGPASHSRVEEPSPKGAGSVKAKNVKAADEGGFSFTDLYDEFFGEEETAVLGNQFIADNGDYYDEPDAYDRESSVRRLGHDHHGGHSHGNHHDRPHEHGSHFWWWGDDDCHCDECCCDECCGYRSGGWFGFSRSDGSHEHHHDYDYDGSFYGGRDGDYEDKDDRWFTRERDTERREDRYDEYQRDLAREFEKGREYERFQNPERPRQRGVNEYERYQPYESKQRQAGAEEDFDNSYGDNREYSVNSNDQRQRMRERAQQRGRRRPGRQQTTGAEELTSIRQIPSGRRFDKDPRFTFSNSSYVNVLGGPNEANVVPRDMKSAIGSSPPALSPLPSQRFNSSGDGGLKFKALLDNEPSNGRKRYQSHPGGVSFDPLNPTPFYNPLTNDKIYPRPRSEGSISQSQQLGRGGVQQYDRFQESERDSFEYGDLEHTRQSTNDHPANRQLSFDKSCEEDWYDDPRFIDDGCYDDFEGGYEHGTDMGAGSSSDINDPDCYEAPVDCEDDQQYYWSSEDNVFADDEDSCDEFGNLKSGFSPFPGYPRYTPLGGIPNPVPDAALSREERVERWHQENLERKRTNRLKAMEERRNHEKAQRATESTKDANGGNSLPYFTTPNNVPSAPNNNLDLLPASSQRHVQSRSKLSPANSRRAHSNRDYVMPPLNNERPSPRARGSQQSNAQSPWFKNSTGTDSGRKRMKMLGGNTGSERVEVPKYKPQPKSKLPYFRQPVHGSDMNSNLKNSTRGAESRFDSGFEDAELTFDDPAFYPIPEQPQYDPMDDYRLRDDFEYIDEDIELSVSLSGEDDADVETQLLPVKPPRYGMLQHEDEPKVQQRRGPPPRPVVNLNPQHFGHIGSRNTLPYESRRQPRRGGSEAY